MTRHSLRYYNKECFKKYTRESLLTVSSLPPTISFNIKSENSISRNGVAKLEFSLYNSFSPPFPWQNILPYSESTDEGNELDAPLSTHFS